MTPLFELDGEPVLPGELQQRWAREFARYVATSESHPFTLEGCRRVGDGEEVAFLARPAVPQRPCHDIAYEEPLLARFEPSNLVLPEVTARRRNFPQVPHLNLRPAGLPKSLCLFAERPEEVRLRWTPALLGERVLWWLTETARGTLHRDDQALEPFIGGFIRPLIVPPDIFSGEGPEVLDVYRASAGQTGEVLLAERPERVPAGLARAKFTLLPFVLPPQQHGVIHFEPHTLLELHRLCEAAGLDLLTHLRRRLQEKIQRVSTDSNGTILVVGIPKTRRAGSRVESRDILGFRCAAAKGSQLTDIGPGALGEALGVLGAHRSVAGSGRGSYVPVVVTDCGAVTKAAARVGVRTLTCQGILTLDQAAALSGHQERQAPRILAVGQGALGSQLFANLARQGFGQWDLVDHDYLAPHNAVRHEVFGRRFGLPKASEMASRANEMFTGPPFAVGVEANILDPGERAAEVAERLAAADVVLDLSASEAVARHLALTSGSEAKRVAAFLSPSGLDLVVMSEGIERKLPLDACEAQYLRAVLRDERLEGHLAGGGERIRYGGSCSDLSGRISQEHVALHAAIGAKAVRDAIGSASPSLTVWRCDPDRMSVSRHDIEVRSAIVRQAQAWTVVADEGLVDAIHEYRSAKLPNETCGVLLGRLDTQNRRVYLIDALPAPPDSVEEQSGCERGVSGLEDAVSAAGARSMDQVTYVGEWHSHPDGAPCVPSESDVTQMRWVEAKLHPEGRPALMLIACEGGAFSVAMSEPA